MYPFTQKAKRVTWQFKAGLNKSHDRKMTDRKLELDIMLGKLTMTRWSTVNIPLCGTMKSLVRLRIIFLPDIFLSFEYFCGVILPC